MVILLLIVFTEILTAVVSSVILIQAGGFMPIFMAILLILQMLLNGSLIIASGLLDAATKHKTPKTNEMMPK